jgi:uncharacterized membrane protein
MPKVRDTPILEKPLVAMPALIAAWLFALSALVSVLVPPFQSPDEFEHLTRAYLLTRGEIVLSAPSGQSSGGMIDSGLARFMESYSNLPFHPERKLRDAEIESAKQLRWTGNDEFRPALGMAYYFPGIYVIHALGLKSGELLDLSIADSYQFTRLLLLIAICAILFLSFSLVPPSYVTVVLLFIPMSIFQFASASLDGLATAIAIWIISLYLKATQDVSALTRRTFYIAIVAWLLLASSRLQMLPLVLLFFAVGLRNKQYRQLSFASIAVILVIGWQILMLKTVVDGRVPLGASSSQVLLFYIQNPIELFGAFHRTLTDAAVLRGYFSSFLGLLGWLDTAFPGAEYKILFFAILAFVPFSIGYANLKSFVTARLILVVCSVSALFIIFFAMLVTWTPHPAIVIDGVQGRYLLVPALLIAYSISDLQKKSALTRGSGAMWFAVCGFGVWSAFITCALLLDRYYLAR